VRRAPVVRALAAGDLVGMSLVDTSPGGFIAVANCVLYATVGVECWMLTTGSLVAMAGMLALIITLSALLCRWAMRLMGPEDAADFTPRPEPRVAEPVPAARARVVGAPVWH
jgi:hypothetical protein